MNDQELNAGKVLNYLAADLYGLCEIVDTARFGRMIRNNLGSDFRYVISFFYQWSPKDGLCLQPAYFQKYIRKTFYGG
ncbi:hypothetical protein LWM68_28250 [Niabella sp. W65]|nr:hypothetical protein [Niabella sp. W65]MCH7366321.1 hypothetical protein [Niabella sp. W65]ULT42045.1 hypothetical protein KRR40_47205 [Niabella sp. I65]